MLNRDEFRLGEMFCQLIQLAPNIVWKIGGFLYSLERESVKRLLLSSAHLLQERLEGDEAVIVSGVAQLLHQVLGLLLGQLLTEVHQQLEQLELQDGVVGIFVVQLQDLNKVVEATLVLGVLAGLVHGEDIGLGQELLSLGTSTSNLLDGLQGGVKVAGTDEVAGVEGVNLAVSLEVIDIKSEVDGINLLLLKTKLSHFVIWGLNCSSLTTIEGEDRTEVPMYSAH